MEGVGLNKEITLDLCREILAGDVGDGKVSSCLDDFIELFRSMDPSLKDKSIRDIYRGRTQIVQHARAYLYLIKAFVVEKDLVSEDLLKKTHRILTRGIPLLSESKDVPGMPSEKYGGIYCTAVFDHVSSDSKTSESMSDQMKGFCDTVNREIGSAQSMCYIDPFSVASRFSLQFLRISPFLEYNGSMSRMIMNVILCRYVGLFLPIGEEEEGRMEYMEMMKRASRDVKCDELYDAHGTDEEEDTGEGIAHEFLRQMNSLR
ncbi:hypothetical protein CP532_3639 [Ophiocordyceps camponoti-leonardi (nom. inval.)]|nr:hypothetical protein CP532_3639 [Ophiocordyceps camponoti-leonardi (nom. inval.)]